MKNKSLIATAVVFFFVGLASALTVRLVPMNHDHGSHAPDLPEEEISILHQPMTDLQGNVTAIADLFGAGGAGETILVNFWASWCAPCVHEMPLLQKAAAQHKVKTIGVSYEEIATVEKFLARHPVDYPLYKSSYDIFYFFQQHGNRTAVLPYTMLINAEGEVIRKKIGDFKTVEEITEFALQ